MCALDSLPSGPSRRSLVERCSPRWTLQESPGRLVAPPRYLPSGGSDRRRSCPAAPRGTSCALTRSSSRSGPSRGALRCRAARASSRWLGRARNSPSARTWRSQSVDVARLLDAQALLVPVAREQRFAREERAHLRVAGVLTLEVAVRHDVEQRAQRRARVLDAAVLEVGERHARCASTMLSTPSANTAASCFSGLAGSLR